MANQKRINKAISWLFLLYFAILFGERAQSLIRIITEIRLFASEYDIIVNLTAIISLCATIIMLLVFNLSFWKSLFTPAEANYSILTITAGVMLVSGMVHTEYTIPGIQFASYGMLIAAMILRTAQLASGAKNRASLWYSLIYLTMFSMAIPVMYELRASDNWAYEKLFYFIEADVMLLLVVSFTLMLRRLFIGKGENLLLWIPFFIMVVGDTAVLWMRWTDEINWFVLIFAAVSAVMFLVGKLIFRKKNG